MDAPGSNANASAHWAKVGGKTLNLLERRTVMTATTSAIIRLFPVALLREVRELVGAEEELFTFTNRLMTFLVGCVDSILNDAFLCSPPAGGRALLLLTVDLTDDWRDIGLLLLVLLTMLLPLVVMEDTMPLSPSIT